MKKYFIREVGTIYDDEYNRIVEGFGGIYDSFDTLEEATSTLKKLTLKLFLNSRFVRSDAFYRSGIEVLKELDNYVQDHFGIQVLIRSPEDGRIMPDDSFTFPRSLTEEQAWEIRRIIGHREMQIWEIKEDEPPLWGFRLGVGMKEEGKWATREAFQVDGNNEIIQHGKVPVFFHSREDAFEYLKEMPLLHYFTPIGIIGTFEELSETPQIFKSLVEQDVRIEYYENANRLILSRLWDNEKLLTINSLLKEKFIEVVPIPFEEVEAMGRGWVPMQ